MGGVSFSLWPSFFGYELEIVKRPSCWDVDQLLACFEAKRIAKKPGRFYMCARKGACGIVKGPTSIKGWVRKWFYASGEWLAKDESGRSFIDVPTRFGNLVSIRPVPELRKPPSTR
ncbi:uncharacterized protein LOC111019307 [Momordica charantia]|uniref:Uncharacterized protein LOC111019307 n=1 Tax=Momordica charantia TaxID=3673 RepID=A0A6J1DAX1_MOMCH|nr:uncharacterized protein LOC111019307 [Momordica charantia]